MYSNDIARSNWVNHIRFCFEKKLLVGLGDELYMDPSLGIAVHL